MSTTPPNQPGPAGSCLCGAVRFEIDGVFESFFLCHCSRCRKGSGSAHAANLFAPGATIRWLADTSTIRTFRVAGTRHERSFCAECGSGLPHVMTGSTVVKVPAGSLDGPVDIRPTAHICCADRANWDAGLEEVTKLDGLPEH